jgi:hypothetical protein
MLFVLRDAKIRFFYVLFLCCAKEKNQKKGAFALRKRMLKIAIRGLRRLNLHAARASNNAAS